MTGSPIPERGKITVLLSHDRSGSHYLGSFLAALPGVRMIDEICNVRAMDPGVQDLSFFAYRWACALEDPEYILRPNHDNSIAFFDRYFSFLLERSNGRHVVVDIKYGHVHNFELHWWPIFQRPFLFAYCQLRGIKLIHLYRWNALEAVVSAFIAEARGIWHMTTAAQAPVEKGSVRLPTYRVIKDTASLQQQRNAFLEWQQQLMAITVTYEELTHPAAGPGFLRKIAEFLEVEPPERFSSPYLKVTPPLPQIIQDWESFAETCRASGFAGYLLGSYAAEPPAPPALESPAVPSA